MLKLSQTGYYALHAVIYTAEHREFLVKIKDISDELRISEALLRRIIAELEKAGILITSRGRNGGISLAKEPNKITVYDILEACWEELGIRDCTKWVQCDNQASCTTTEVLTWIQRGFNALLRMYTLDKFIK